MGLGFSLPWMLPWLLAAIIPPILAWLAVRHPRLVRFGATELVARAAKTQRLTRGGLPLPQTLLRSLMLVAAALAAASPFLPPAATGWRQRPRSDDGRIDSGQTPRRIEIVSGRPLPVRDAADGDGTLAIRLALEALAPSKSSAPTVELVTTDEAARGPSAGQTLIILCAGAVPPTADTARIGSAVAAGAALLVCIGPESIAERDRLRLSAWLDALAGISVEGSLDLADATIEVNADLAMPADAGLAANAGLAAAESMIQLADFWPLAGPTVTAAAELTIQAAAGSVATVLARTAPAGRPLLVAKPSGLGTVCVSALPLTLAADADRETAWSDLAAWPVFVPLLDRLVEHLIPPPIGGKSPPSSSRQRTAPQVSRSFLPLPPMLIAIAIGLAIVDRLLSAQATGGGLTPLQKAGHAATLVSLIGICVLWFMGAWWPPSPRDGRPPRLGRLRPIALVIDISPSMAGCDAPDQAEDLQEPAREEPTRVASRLESLTGALTGPGADGSPLDRIARDHPLMLFTAAADSALLGEYPRDVTAKDLRSLTTVAAAAHASRLGDAIEDILRNGDDSQAGMPAVIVIATDGGITAGASWQRAARAAADRGVHLIAVPIGDGATGTPAGELPPGFRLTSVTAPRLSRFTEPLTIEVRAEAAANGGPLPLAVFAPGDAFGQPIATGILTHDPAPPETTDTSCRYFGRLTVPPHGFQTQDSHQDIEQDRRPESHPAADSRSVLISPVLCAGTFSAGGGPRSATVLTTVPLALTDTPTRVLFIETVPRYEWRFLEQFVASTAGFEVETCMLATHTTSQRQAGRPLPQSAAEWNHFDVVVLGDLSADPDAPAAEHSAAWDSLRSAAEIDGIGIAWIPGRSWWGSQTDIRAGIQADSQADNLGWLPASLNGSASLPGEPPHRVQVTAGGRASGWLPFAADSFHPEVFAVMHPVSLRPTARILATAAGAPAVFVDRQGRGTVLGHLCETWRWRHENRSEYERFWKQSLLRLAEPHLLRRLFAATINVRPLAPEVGDRVRIDLVPGHAANEPTALALNGWRAELLVGAADQTAVRQIPLPEDREPGRTITVMVDGLGAGLHTLRLVPPAAGTEGLPPAPVVRDFIVNEPILEVAGGLAGLGPADNGPLRAAVLAAGGSIVTLDRIATLPDAIASVLPTGSSESPPEARGHTTGGSGYASIALANLLMLSLVFSAVMAWWQPSTFPRREAT